MSYGRYSANGKSCHNMHKFRVCTLNGFSNENSQFTFISPIPSTDQGKNRLASQLPFKDQGFHDLTQSTPDSSGCIRRSASAL